MGIVWMVSQALMPLAIGRAIDAITLDKDTQALLAWSGMLLALGVFQALSGLLRHRLAVFNWLAAAYRTIQVITRQAVRLGPTLPKRLTTGEVVSVGVADVSRIGDAMDIVARGSGSIVSIIMVATILLTTMPQLGIVVVIGIPVIIGLFAPLMRPFHRRQTHQRELTGELTTRAADIVGGLRVLRGIGGERMFGRRYREESQRVRAAGVRLAQAESVMDGAGILLPGLLMVVVVWLGAHYAASGEITGGQLLAFYGYSAFLVQPLETLGEAADRLTKAHIAARRIIRVLDLEPEFPGLGTREPAHGDLADPETGLVVRAERLTAIATADPHDAQTLADRLGGYADPAASFGDVPLDELADLRGRILVSINEDRLFTGVFHDEIGEAGIWAACAEDILESVGPDSTISEGGREFSGGQQQRLRLARALQSDPEVLILVEPTSAVDAHTEARIAERLGKHRNGQTTVVFTTSPLVLDKADHVVFVDEGLVEGTHRELLTTSPAYRAVVTRGEDS